MHARTPKPHKPTGYVIYDGPSRIDHAPIVAILITKAKNTKTANMAQLWIMRSDVDPGTAVRTGQDGSVCGIGDRACVHRPIKQDDGTYTKGSCYVQVDKAPASIFKAYKRGRYPVIGPAAAAALIAGRPVRLGAYGEPAALPRSVVELVTLRAPKHTGYTHQWVDRQDLRGLVMASVDTVQEAYAAHALGFRTFRVSKDGQTLPGEIVCPASKEAGYRTTCDRCGLCDGKRGDTDRRRNIAILAHGGTAVRFFKRADLATIGIGA